MRPLMRPRGAPCDPRRDPAPSRISYRLTRMWLSPRFRKLVTVILPVGLLLGAAGAYLTRPAQQEMLVGWTQDVIASVEARPEFQIRQAAITGASPKLSNAIRERIEVAFPVSWFRIDPEAIQTKIAGLDAVADVQVSVELGGALRLAISEREPAIIWRRTAALELLDETGHRIAFIDRRDGRADLPLVTGEGADAAVPEALDLIAVLQPFERRLRGLTRRGERRWDVVLDRSQIIQLPETDPHIALERVLGIDKTKDLLARDIPVVDMRDPDRPVIRLGPQAMDYLRVTRAFQKGLSTK